MANVPEIEPGIFLGVEPREDGVALIFERAVIVVSEAAALAVGYLLTAHET